MINQESLKDNKTNIILNLFQIEDTLRETCQLLNKWSALNNNILIKPIEKNNQNINPINNELYYRCFSSNDKLKTNNNDSINKQPITCSVNNNNNQKNLNSSDTIFHQKIIEKLQLNYTYKTEQEIEINNDYKRKLKQFHDEKFIELNDSPNINISFIKEITEQNDYKIIEKSELETFNFVQHDDEKEETKDIFELKKQKDYNISESNNDSQKSLYIAFKNNESSKQEAQYGNNDINYQKDNHCNQRLYKVSHLVNILKNNNDLFEMLGFLYDSENIINLLYNITTKNEIIDSIALAIMEIEKLKSIN